MALIRNNVIGHYNGGTAPANISRGVTIVIGDSVLVDGNVIGVTAEDGGLDWRILVNSTKDMSNRKNLRPDGTVVLAVNNNTTPALAIPDDCAAVADRILDGLTLCL